ncbi:MAG: ATP-binding protein [Gammaproteobacteria bacterium]|nr:ATP-binding protein [Gammaproteobacteria bacterium]
MLFGAIHNDIGLLHVRLLYRLAFCLFGLGCWSAAGVGLADESGSQPQLGPNHLRIASARSAKDLKIVDALAEQFRFKFPQFTVSIQSGGVLNVLDDGRNSLADVILTHHKPGETHFVKEGYALRHTQIMYTEYALFGPPGDPLQLSAEKDIVSVFKRLAQNEAEFLAPSPRSGTYMKIQEIWTMAGIDPDWIGYENTGGSGYATLLQAAEFGVYTVAEMATYLSNKEKIQGEIIPLFRDDLDLRNVYSLLVVNPLKVPGVNADLGLAFHDYLVSEEGQNFIRQFGEETFYAEILTPAAHLDPGLKERTAQQILEEQTKELNLAIVSSISLFVLLVISVFLFLRMRVIERKHIESEARNAALELARDEIMLSNQLLQQEIEERKITETQLSKVIELLNTSEEELRKYHDHLETLVQSRTRELESAVKELEAFSYSVSHDLRSPLRSINGFSRVIMDDYYDVLDEEGKEFLKRIVNASLRMDLLIDGLLQLSRISRQEPQYKTVNMSSLARDVLENLCAGDRSRHVIVEIEDDINVECDENLLRIVLHNFISNALKYTAKIEQPHVSIGKSRCGKGVCYFVKDNGVGFDMKYSDKLFKPFQRLHSDEAYKGNGIGLSTVQRIIQRHGGIVWAESTPGQGAIFYFTLSPARDNLLLVSSSLPN